MLSCPIPDYGSRFDNVDVVGAAAILNVLAHTHTNPHLVPAHDTPSVWSLFAWRSNTVLQAKIGMLFWDAGTHSALVLASPMKPLLVSCWNVLPNNLETWSCPLIQTLHSRPLKMHWLSLGVILGHSACYNQIWLQRDWILMAKQSYKAKQRHVNLKQFSFDVVQTGRQLWPEKFATQTRSPVMCF